MSEGRNDSAVWLAIVVGLLYLGIWMWCKLSGQKPEMES